MTQGTYTLPPLKCLIILYLPFVVEFVSQMKAVVLAEMLRDVLDVKIKKCRKDMLDAYRLIEVERIQAQIMAYQWVQAKIQDLVIDNEDKDTKIRI